MIDLLRNRRSTRVFTAQAIEPDKIKILQEAALRAPSSRNLKPCEFIFVTDKILLEKLATAKPHGAAFLQQAPLGIVIVGNADVSDVWIEDCSIATILLQATAESLQLGSCWIQIRQRVHDSKQTAGEYIQQLLHIPAHLKVLSMLAIGYPAEGKVGMPYEKLNFSAIHQELYKK